MMVAWARDLGDPLARITTLRVGDRARDQCGRASGQDHEPDRQRARRRPQLGLVVGQPDFGGSPGAARQVRLRNARTFLHRRHLWAGRLRCAHTALRKTTPVGRQVRSTHTPLRKTTPAGPQVRSTHTPCARPHLLAGRAMDNRAGAGARCNRSTAAATATARPMGHPHPFTQGHTHGPATRWATMPTQAHEQPISRGRSAADRSARHSCRPSAIRHPAQLPPPAVRHMVDHRRNHVRHTSLGRPPIPVYRSCGSSRAGFHGLWTSRAACGCAATRPDHVWYQGKRPTGVGAPPQFQPIGFVGVGAPDIGGLWMGWDACGRSSIMLFVNHAVRSVLTTSEEIA